jgi:ubiquinone/menaquinone biosynthesis C-methylase UbiE
MSFAAGAKKQRENALPSLPGIAAALRNHPAVQDAVTCRIPGGPIHAFVAANENYLDHILGRKENENAQLRRWRKTYDLSQMAKTAAASPFAFNITGWNSSYTRQPLSPEDMREWVQTTVDRIASFAPKEVLEIGCGTGLLLLRLAPGCVRYVGMDFAPSVLARLREQLAQTDLSRKVELLERPADDFTGFAENSFDLVIINSVAQYFPSRAYLDHVLENALRVARPGGHVFVGDKRNFILHQAHAVSIEAFQVGPESTVGELRDRVGRRLQQEQELVPSPAYFLSVPQQFPKISAVEIHPRRGACDNEMTRFRFDAILSIGAHHERNAEIPFLVPPAKAWSLADLRSALHSENSAAIGFAHIRNVRVEKDVLLAARLASADSSQPLAHVSRDLDQTAGVHPEEIFRLAAETGFQVALSWASCYPDGAYDAAFVRQTCSGAFPAVNWPEPVPGGCVYFSNAPRQAEIREKLVNELSEHIRTQSPGATPQHVHLVDSIPRGSDGEPDLLALLSAVEKVSRDL